MLSQDTMVGSILLSLMLAAQSAHAIDGFNDGQVDDVQAQAARLLRAQPTLASAFNNASLRNCNEPGKGRLDAQAQAADVLKAASVARVRCPTMQARAAEIPLASIKEGVAVKHPVIEDVQAQAGRVLQSVGE
jgi:hypothetical protein